MPRNRDRDERDRYRSRRTEYDPARPGRRAMTLRERLQRVSVSSNPQAATEVSRREAALLLDTMSWREKKEREREEEYEEPSSVLSLATSKPGTSYRAKKRKTRYSKVVRAGCEVCEPTLATMWRNVGSAARHYDATGHKTWSESAVRVWYGEEPERVTKAVDYILPLDDEES